MQRPGYQTVFCREKKDFLLSSGMSVCVDKKQKKPKHNLALIKQLYDLLKGS